MRRVEALANDLFNTLLDNFFFKKVDIMTLAVDESTDGRGRAGSNYTGGTYAHHRCTDLSACLAALPPQMKPLHCLLHQSLHCAKLSSELKSKKDRIMSMMSFIRSTSSLQHHFFRKLLSDMSAEHSDLHFHNNVRWLSMGNALKRVCELREKIIAFLRDCNHKKAVTFLSRMQDEEYMEEVCFLNDIFQHFIGLNLQLQGKNKTVHAFVDQLNGF